MDDVKDKEDLRNGLVTTHEDLSIVLIKSTLVVTNGWHVLDNHTMVRMFTLLVKNGVGCNHVIDDVGLGNFLGAELLLRTEVLSIVVTKMVVTGDSSELDTSTDQEVDEGRLHLGLARFEVVTTNEGVVSFGELDATGDEGVLWRAIDEWSIFENASNCEDGRWRNLFVSVLNGLEKVVGSIVDTVNEVGKTFGIGSPLDDDLVETVVGLEVTK
jgi:hypothetical protein